MAFSSETLQDHLSYTAALPNAPPSQGAPLPKTDQDMDVRPNYFASMPDNSDEWLESPKHPVGLAKLSDLYQSTLLEPAFFCFLQVIIPRRSHNKESVQ